MSETISVVIPTWNRADTICAAISSALSQTIQPLEILICDDGSDDNTNEVVASINHPLVRWLPGAHTGCPAVPRNRGIRIARGEWIAFLDSDDTWEPDKLKKQLEGLQRTKCKASCTNAWNVRNNAKQGLLYELSRDSILEFEDFLRGNPVVCSSAIVHRSILELTGGFPNMFEMRAIEDYAAWYRVVTLTNFCYIAEPLVLYNDNPSQSLRSIDSKFPVQRNLIWTDFWEWLTPYQFATNYKMRLVIFRLRLFYEEILMQARTKVRSFLPK